MQLYTETEVKQFLLEMAKRCREDMELPLNVYLENVSKNIDEITYVHPLEDDIPPTSQYFLTSSQTEISEQNINNFDEGIWNDYWKNILKKEDCSTNGKRDLFIDAYLKGVNSKSQTEISDDRTKLHWKTSLVIHTPQSDDSWEGCDGCTEQDEVMYKNGYLKGYNVAISELPKEISDEEIAIKFAEWCRDNAVSEVIYGELEKTNNWELRSHQKVVTTKELFKIFLNGIENN